MPKGRTAKVKNLASSILDRWSMFLVDVEIQGGKSPAVWVYVDAEQRDVGLDECAEVSQELGFLLDAYELFDRSYRLNVSTPGVDRPLMDRRQYRKNMGRKARITLNQQGEENQIEGRIKEVDEQNVKLEEQQGDDRTIPFTDIVKTVIVPEIN